MNTGTLPSGVPQIDVLEAAQLAGDGSAVLLDVRQDDEWAVRHAPGAMHLPLRSVPPAAVPVLAICRFGNRSGKAAAVLAAAGVDVRNIAGGLTAWAAVGLPVWTEDGRPGAVA